MIPNKRDLGGIRTKDGRRIRPGMLVRSAMLGKAEEKDLEGISAVIDLRTAGERGEAPDRTFGQEYLPLPVFEEVNAGISHEERTRNAVIPDMAYLYGLMMKQNADSFRKILLAIMGHDYDTGAVLWHCTEGKDRCGMTAALVLEALGVDREDILKDYLKTNLVNVAKAEAIRAKLVGSHGEEFADSVYRAYIADERYLRSAWEAMGPDYIHDVLGLGEDELEAFRDTVLE